MKRFHFMEILNINILIEIIVMCIVIVLAAAFSHSAAFSWTGPGHRHGISRPIVKVMNGRCVHKDPANATVDRTGTSLIRLMELQNSRSQIAPSAHELLQQGEKDRRPKENRSYDHIYWDQLATA